MALARLDGRFNMAEDARLLEEAEAGQTGWRVYGWDGPWVSLGHYQSPERDLLDPELVSWVMRPTGGKAVLHGHDVTVGLAVPVNALREWDKGPRDQGTEEGNRSESEGIERQGAADLSRSLKTVYRLAIRPILEAMRACGVPAVLGEEFRTPPPPFPRSSEKGEGNINLQPLAPSSGAGGGRSSDCFAAVSPNDVVDERTGLKVCGCALKLTQSAVLVQASLPAGTPLINPRAVFARPAVLASLPWDSEAFPEAFAAAMAARSTDFAVR